MDALGNKQILEPDVVLTAYCNGYFPMADSGTGLISWYSPDPRAVIPLDKFRVPRSLRAIIRRKVFDVRINAAFDEVIRMCAGRKETWISSEIIAVYTALNRSGYAHSVESWCGGRLAGGLYGVAIGGAFFGESMFSVMSNASKVALTHLVDILRLKRFGLLDTQFVNEHLRHHRDAEAGVFGEACECPFSQF
jgi:leucyl/phenylalanyl-tRNA--protein transferase